MAQQLSLSEAGAQVEEASVREEGEGTKEKEIGKEKGVEEGKEEAFGDFQGAEGVTSEAPVTSSSVATALLNGGSSPTGDGEQPAVIDSGSSPTENGEQPQSVLTDATTNLQPTSADFVTGMHTCSSSIMIFYLMPMHCRYSKSVRVNRQS